MSDTPKTDAVAFWITNERVRREAVFADFARDQERRIAELESKRSWECDCGEWNHHFDTNCGECGASKS